MTTARAWLLALVLLTSCTVRIPNRPPLPLCFPAKSMQCNPHIRVGLV